ncbi:MAG: EAL domain-containing protein [Helicobacteraceae bacterium]|nr:EAL domain-containing protein [Helicobacteraceae bacterium]
MQKSTSYTKITIKIISFTLIVTLLTSYLYGEYIKENAITELAYTDAKKTSLLVFESLYSSMQKGWSRDDLNGIIIRLNNVDENMRVDVYRSDIVSNLFGKIATDKEKFKNDPFMSRAILGEEILNISDDDLIDYYYPVTAEKVCLKCHTNATIGDMLGVINISYPIKNLKISLTEMINFFIIFMVMFSIVIFLALFFELNKYLIKPIKNFSNVIKNITNSNDVTKRVEALDHIEELDSIKEVFNTMLDSIEYQFYYDSLTGLQNRRKLSEKLETRSRYFLMLINIDYFQEINDLYGEETGDSVLKEFAQFLQELVPERKTLFRLHADEFAHLCEMAVDIEEYTNLVNLIYEKISQKSFKIKGQKTLQISATIGIAYGSSNLLANADIALKIAKKGKKDFLFYDDSMTIIEKQEKNFKWTKRIKDAITNDKIVPLFQPIVDAKTNEVVKYESLMRMVDDDGSYIAPIHFLELAKKNKLYHQLTKIMIEKTFKRFENSSLNVSINISVEDILNKDIYEFILDTLEQSSISKQIVFEIIESEGIENFDRVLEFIQDVKHYGVKISIDDFGTGYSNFEYLMKLKVDYIKIDGSMIKNIDVDESAQMITSTIVDFAKKLNIKTVAEFVHSKDVYDKTVELDVDYLQGYYFGKPSDIIKNS